MAREKLLDALKEHLLSRGGVVAARKKIAERLGELSREWNKEINERRGRLARTEARIQGLIGFIADGDHSAYIRSTLTDLEAQAKAEKETIADFQRQMAAPVRLPTPAEVEKSVFDLEAMLAVDING